MTISVFWADDNLLVREGVRALMELAEDLQVVGVAGDFDGLVDGATALVAFAFEPTVNGLVTG